MLKGQMNQQHPSLPRPTTHKHTRPMGKLGENGRRESMARRKREGEETQGDGVGGGGQGGKYWLLS